MFTAADTLVLMVEPPSVESLLEPYREDLGRHYAAYRNHVLRQLALCDLLGVDQTDPDTRIALKVAAVFHDLGIWTERTWDYIEPSLDLAEHWLMDNGRDDLKPIVARLIREHHGLSARGEAKDPVEVFRRADVIEVWFGLRRYGLPYAEYRKQLKLHPEAGLHTMIVTKFFKNLVRHPLRPLPMFKL